jgi:hypothetical protein
MNSSSIFWKSVEAIGQGAREAALKRYLNEAYGLIRPYLMPCPNLASQIACPRTLEGHGCQYRIVEEPEPDGTHAAVCDQHHCPTKFHTREELVRYTLNPQLMIPAIARCLGLHPQIGPMVDDAWQIGHVPGSAMIVPVLFTRVKEEISMRRVFQSLILKGSRRFVLVTPSVRYLGNPCSPLHAQINGQTLPLDEVTEMNGHEPVLTVAGRVRWKKLKETIGGTAVLGVTFPTPPDAAWHDLTLVFRDGHTVVASIGHIKAAYTFQDMGMVNRKNLAPDEQWQLLYQFAEEMGVFTWTSQYADYRNKKRKGRLAARLKAFFGIPGSPFSFRQEDGGWETVFNIRIA